MGSNKKTPERLLCEDYCRQYPEMKSLTLARKISNECGKKYPKLQDAERVRKIYVNAIRGLSGNEKRKTVVDKSQFQPLNYDTTNTPYREQIDTGAKILILDIETAPIKAFVWNIWNVNVQLCQIESDWFCLTWAAKWLFDDKVYSGCVTPKEAVRQDDKRMIAGIWKLVNEADLVIAHNGEKFDMPKLNTRFLIHGLNPPLPYQQIDTLKHIRRNFGFTSNKLDYVNQLLNLERKKETSFELWRGCYEGNKEALAQMLDYNIQDVRILENTYLRIRPWIKPHPNLGLFILDEKQSRCPCCGSADLKDEGKNYLTTANVYELLRCNNCGASARKRTSAITIKQRRHLTLSVAR